MLSAESRLKKAASLKATHDRWKREGRCPCCGREKTADAERCEVCIITQAGPRRRKLNPPLVTGLFLD